ncbi:hypothetical protein KIL84_020944 [Mauremys mutica]|uniref:Uncharacterized protein n=1 Tax=Mauremys mutica TaxID=74926 RepID=A0A9D3XBX8_9SAUR|nr:hypothetical protein KIL84_020944 [Mauremys mutica]
MPHEGSTGVCPSPTQDPSVHGAAMGLGSGVLGRGEMGLWTDGRGASAPAWELGWTQLDPDPVAPTPRCGPHFVGRGRSQTSPPCSLGLFSSPRLSGPFPSHPPSLAPEIATCPPTPQAWPSCPAQRWLLSQASPPPMGIVPPFWTRECNAGPPWARPPPGLQAPVYACAGPGRGNYFV